MDENPIEWFWDKIRLARLPPEEIVRGDLTSSVGFNDLKITIQNRSSFPVQPGFRVMVGNELMVATKVLGDSMTVT